MSEPTENQLLADIDQLRNQFPQTQDLYREVCILLFFRYGVTPTTNKLYQLVRKGSMSAPAEALNKFWEDLRDKSRIRIEHPDLPEVLKAMAGDLVATLWSTAHGAAQEGFVELCGEAQARVAEAREVQATAESEREAMRASHALVRQTLVEAHARIGELERALAARNAIVSSLEGQLQNARDEKTELQQKLEDARRDFSLELEKLRSGASLSEERFCAAETRALLEIDRERTAAAKLQKELEKSRASIEDMAERHRAEVMALSHQLGNYRQKTGELEGNLKAVSENRNLLIEDLNRVKEAFDAQRAQLARVESETITLRTQLEEERRKPEDREKVSKPARATRAKQKTSA
jgi:chromosome segregation ATPase